MLPLILPPVFEYHPASAQRAEQFLVRAFPLNSTIETLRIQFLPEPQGPAAVCLKIYLMTAGPVR